MSSPHGDIPSPFLSSSKVPSASSTIGGPAAATLIGAWARKTSQNTTSTAASNDNRQAERDKKGATRSQPTQRLSGLAAEEEKAFLNRFLELRRNLTGCKEFVRNHPVCDSCLLHNQPCIVYRNVACTFCRKKHKACPRLRDYYAHGLAGKGMTENDVLRALTALGKIKGSRKPANTEAPALTDNDDMYIVIESSDDDDNSDKEEGEIQTRGVIRGMSGVSINSPQDRKIKVEDRISELEREVERLNTLLARAQEKEAENKKDIIDRQKKDKEKQAKITHLEAKLKREKHESERIRAQFQGGNTDSQKIMKFLAQIGIHCSTLRKKEEALRLEQGADTSALAKVVKRLQEFIDDAVEKEQNRTSEISISEPAFPTSNSVRRKRAREDDTDQNESSSEEDPQQVRARRPKANPAGSVKAGRTTASEMDQVEGPSNSKRFRHS